MFERLSEVEDKYVSLEKQLADPEVFSDRQAYQRLAKAHADLSDVVGKWREYKDVEKQLADTEEMLREPLDDELRELAQLELDTLKEKLPVLEQELKIMLLPQDSNDEKDVIVEIRAGTGGEEAGLFAADLLRMYTRFAERKGWKPELMSSVETGIGGYKDAVLAIKGQGAYSRLKFEGGVHRVQRVPATESSGRVHTSAATVSVLPEADEIDVQINQDDLEIDTYRASSAGGQHVNKTDSAIRILHTPTGIVVTCQDERSQLQNKLRAMRMLRTQLYEREQQAQQEETAAARRTMVRSGDRSDKSRTYNYPQNRITDHRIDHTMHNLPAFMDGDLDEIIDRLNAADQAEKLQSVT